MRLILIISLYFKKGMSFMAKRDCNRKGYLKGSVRSRIVCEKQLLSIEKTIKNKKDIRKPQLGPRALAWNEFKKTGKINRAYEMIAEIYGENTFSNNVVLRWINEEMQKEEQKREDLKGSSYDEAR